MSEDRERIEEESAASHDGIEAQSGGAEGAGGPMAGSPEPEAAPAGAAEGEPIEGLAGAPPPEGEQEVERAADAAMAPDPEEEERLRELLTDEPTVEEEALEQAKEDEEEPPADISEVVDESGAFEKLVAKARRLSDEQVRHGIHSLLFVADKPLTVEQIRQVTGLEPKRIRQAIDELSGTLREGISGVILSEVAKGWQLRTAPESADFVRRFLQVKPRRLTRAALETLAIIAYRQPVTRPEIEDIRGVDSGAVVKALLEWKLIKILGKKDEVGRPILYGTSREFLEFFQLKDLASLPTLREFHELSEESRDIVEDAHGPEAVAGIEGTVAELMDPAFQEAERTRAAKSEAALAELEQAMADAEAKAGTVEKSLNPNAADEDAADDPEGS